MKNSLLRLPILCGCLIAAFQFPASAQPSGSTVADGGSPDWTRITPAATDPAEGATPCDWRKLFLAKNKTTLFLRYVTEGTVDFNKGAAYMILIDTDQSKQTGFQGANGQFSVGADYALQGKTLYKYIGNGTDWNWESLGMVDSNVANNEAEFMILREQIGNPNAVDIILYGDNEAVGVDGSILDVMPDSALTSDDGKITFSLK